MSYAAAAHWIRDKLATVWTGRSEPLVWENVPYEPTTGSAWVRASTNESTARQAEVGTAALWRHYGLLVAEVFTPAGLGPGAALELADVLVAGFRAAEGTQDSTHVQFAAPYAVTVGETDGWFKVDVIAPYWRDD